MNVPIPPAENVPVDQLRVDGDNPNRMTDRQHKALRQSIERYGFIVPIITNQDLLIADGEQRWVVAKDMGMPAVSVIRLPVEDVDRRLLRQVLNKLRGEHELVADAYEFQRIIEAGHEDDLKHLLDLEDNQLKMYLETLNNPNLNIIMLNKQPSSIQLLPYRPITPYGKNIYRVSVRQESHEKRRDALYIVKKDTPIPTLKARKWLFHEDGREFSLREYAQVQDFPDSFIFVGSYDEIKQQIGNAVPPTMAYYIAKQIPPSKALSLFSGCGGMDLGFQQAGHSIQLSSDWDVHCAYTHKANFPNTPFILKDIHTLTLKNMEKYIHEIDLIFGGPPCQGFSMSGLRFKDDPRNNLYKEYLRIIGEVQPTHFVMENVMGILSYQDQIIEDMKQEGYDVLLHLIKGEEIGMRQKRHRVFFVGKKHDGD